MSSILNTASTVLAQTNVEGLDAGVGTVVNIQAAERHRFDQTLLATQSAGEDFK